MLCGLIRARPCIGPCAAATAVVQSHRQEGLHVGPWAAQLVGGVSNEPLLAPGGGLQTVEHRIHGLGQVGHFVARDRRGHPLGHVAAADLGDPAAYSLDRCQRATLCTGFGLDRLGIRNPTRSACWLPTWFTSRALMALSSRTKARRALVQRMWLSRARAFPGPKPRRGRPLGSHVSSTRRTTCWTPSRLAPAPRPGPCGRWSAPRHPKGRQSGV